MGSLFILLCLTSFVLVARADVGVSDDIAKEFDIKEFTLEDEVLVLGKADFKKAVEKIKFLLVEFYAPWCGHCKQLAPEYAKAAKDLASENSEIRLAKVDATEESELAEEYGVRGYPTLKFFKKGVTHDYTGGRQADSIISWLKKKTGPPAKPILTVEEFHLFTKNNTVAVVGHFKNPESDLATKFLNVASMIDDHPFGIVTDEALHKELELEDEKIHLHKSFDEGKVEFPGEATEEALKSFIVVHSLPLVVEFSHETATKIFGGDIKSHILLFFSKKDGHYEQHLESAKNVAKDFREKTLFVTINTDEEDHVRILEFFGMKKEDVPTIRAIKLEDEMSKFKPETTEMSAEMIKKFVGDFVAGTLKQHYLSQILPEDWDAKPVKVLVASNFESVVMDTSKDVLVEFYAPWCGHCKQLAPIYDQLAEKFKDKEDIVIAKLDATVNELEGTKIASFPTISLYPKDKSKVVEYNGERTLEGLSKFIETGGEYGKAVEPEAAKEGEEEEEEEEDEDKSKETPKDEL